jgi:hypothetical protein
MQHNGMDHISMNVRLYVVCFGLFLLAVVFVAAINEHRPLGLCGVLKTTLGIGLLFVNHLEKKIKLNCNCSYSPYRAVNTLPVGYKNPSVHYVQDTAEKPGGFVI